MANLREVNQVLFDQLTRLSNQNYSKEDQEIELKRSAAINATAGNIIKISTLSLQAVSLKMRSQEVGYEIEHHELDLIGA